MTADGPAPAAHAFTAANDAGVIRRASRRLFWLRTRLYIAITVGLAALAAALALAIHAEPLETGLALFLLVAFPLVWLLRYQLFRRHAERSFASFYGASMTWRFEAETMAWEGGKMQGRLDWSLVKTLYLWPEAWVLFYRNNSFNVVPAAGLDPAVRAFVRAAALSHGAKVVETG